MSDELKTRWWPYLEADKKAAAEIAKLKAEIEKLNAELEAARNDLYDALDLKAGHGPTVLTRLVRERDEIRAELEQARKQLWQAQVTIKRLER